MSGKIKSYIFLDKMESSDGLEAGVSQEAVRAGLEYARGITGTAIKPVYITGDVWAGA